MIRTLSKFAQACGGQLLGDDATFAAVGIDSRKLAGGDLFLALPGEHADGHDFVAQAAAAGAAGAVVTHGLPVSLPQIVVADVAEALMAAGACWRQEFHGPLIGVAGSNGKTTSRKCWPRFSHRSGVWPRQAI
jgi:UDP-N-acetylmuramoyl-tripeptide--D-alanyl-D-alanine ligase